MNCPYRQPCAKYEDKCQASTIITFVMTVLQNELYSKIITLIIP